MKRNVHHNAMDYVENVQLDNFDGCDGSHYHENTTQLIIKKKYHETY